VKSSVPLSTATIGRVVFLRCDEPPSHEALDAAAAHWLGELSTPALNERMLAWERLHPLEIGVHPIAEVRDHVDVLYGQAGVEEAAGFHQATHAISVLGESDAARDGWLGVDAFARGVARAWGGVVVDSVTRVFRPLDGCHEPLAEVTPSEVSNTTSLPIRENRWLFLTHGLGNLGIPEVWFEDVPGTKIGQAIAVIQTLRDRLAEAARAHRCAGRDGDLVLDPIEVPHVGPVALVPARDSLSGMTSFRVVAVGQSRVALGRLIARRRPRRRPTRSARAARS